MAINLTKQQQAVVDDRGGNLLVSAAAGSGKTRVLVERLMGYIEQGENIDRFLVITFTNAAAAELRQRIAGAIHGRLAEDPGNARLRRNATLVYKAPICTIDAFCMDFLRQWGHLADLDPDFRLCDQAEGDELRRQALQEVLERRYTNIASDPAFEALVDALAGERDDQTLEDVILDMHRRVQAQADPGRWLMERRADYDIPGDALPEDTVWGRLLLEDAKELAEYWLDELNELRAAVNTDALLDQNFGPSLDTTAEGVERLLEGLSRGWDQAAACFPIEFPRAGGKRGECDAALKERVKDQRDRCKKQLGELAARFEVTAAEAVEDLRAIGPSMVALLEVTGEFDRAFEELKRKRRLIDFADGEHLTARLLADGAGSPTELAREVGREFVEIMVDEYQDTNAVQNTIFNALSNGKNLFLVGDVKQSIYRFRLADPTIFLEKYHRFLPCEAAKEGEERKILLSHNFRSRPEVLDGANFIFENVMTRAAGELDYTEAEALRAGRDDLIPDPRYRVELNCVDVQSDGEEKRDKDAVMAGEAARRIRQLLDSGMTVGERPLRPEDVVILLRSPGPVLRHYAAALDALNIPWSAEGGYEFFGTTEISVVVSLLQIVDNPRQDVPLLAVLRSPVCGFTPDRLARLRAGQEGCVYDCLCAAARRGEEDCGAFLAQLEELRDLAAELGSHHLLRHIYDGLHLPALFAALPEGERRRANLMALYDEACRFESGGHRGLMAFLLHLSRMAENGVAVPVAAGEGVGGVRILSIHKSKGLEFPVVLLCGLERRFNESDIHNTILFHPELGLGPKRTDRSRMLRYTTIARDAVALRLKRQLRAEEMRLLYVAMTRAEHKLILFTAVNGPLNSLKSLAARAQCPPSPRQMGAAASMAEWVLTPALCRPDSGALWADLDGERPAPATSLYGWDINLIRGETAGTEAAPAPIPAEEERPGTELPEGWAEHLNWVYPHAAAENIRSKLTATQLKGRGKDREAAEDGVELRPTAGEVTLRPPCFTGDRPLTAAQRGTALHMAMQYLDFGRTGSLVEIEDEIARLVTGQYLTPQQGAAVDRAAILTFFRSDLGQRLLQADELEREFKFSMLVPAGEYYPEAEGLEDEVLLQGVVDCWFREADGTVTVVDFKTDRVTAHTIRTRAEDYAAQIEVYTRALGEMLGAHVGRRMLWFFALGEAVEL